MDWVISPYFSLVFWAQKNTEKSLVSKRPTLADRFPFDFDGQVLKMLKEEQDEMRIRIVYLGWFRLRLNNMSANLC